MNVKGAAIQSKSDRLGAVQIGIIVLTILTAVIHVILAIIAPDPTFTPLFLLNGVGYLTLLAGLFLPIPFARQNRGLLRWVLIGFTALTILAWLFMGDKTLPQAAMGYVTKAIEVVLIILLLIDRR
jgi:hypothetical protein